MASYKLLYPVQTYFNMPIMDRNITDVDGLGGTMATKIEDATGISSLEDLASASPSDLEDVKGISSSRAQKWINEAKESTVMIKSGDQVYEEFQNLQTISTGIEEMDTVLGGGWDAGFIVAIGGETGSGKTQLAFQSLGEATKIGAPAVYIETERGRYRGNRIREMFGEDVQQNIYKVEAYNLEQQLAAYNTVKKQFDDLSMVVVDSFTARFRLTDDFSGRENFASRSEAFGKHLTALEELASVHDIPVLLTCQVYEDVSGYGGGYVIYGGSLMMHTVNFVVMLRNRSGALSNIKIKNHPEVGEEDIEIQITEDGINSTA